MVDRAESGEPGILSEEFQGKGADSAEGGRVLR